MRTGYIATRPEAYETPALKDAATSAVGRTVKDPREMAAFMARIEKAQGGTPKYVQDIRKVVEEITRRLETEIRNTLSGRLNRFRHSRDAVYT